MNISQSIDDARAHYTPLPDIDEELFRRTAGAGKAWSDARRFPRSPARTICVLESEATFASSGFANGWQHVWLRDVSRGGVRLIHGSQLFPSERCALTLASGVEMRLEVVWCRRLAASVFVSGCHYMRAEEP
jgi:hypothetical protein